MNYSGYVFGKPLSEIDPEVARIIEYEEERQTRKIIMIPSESICPAPVLEALGSVFNNIYAEGYPPGMMTEEAENKICEYNFQLARYRRYSDRRFYKGCEYANFLEILARRRAASLFATERNPRENIYVNIQPLSGAAANNSVYNAFVDPGEVVMGMSLMHGGHLTHGSEFNRSGRNYSIVSYEVSPKTEKLDYDEIMNLAKEHRPKMIIAGYTSYPWAPDWARFREISDSVGAILLADISHPAGLVTAGVYPNPIDYADVVTLTTHKTLFGPRGAIIMTTKREYAERIDQAVFPGEQGGPHVNKFAAMAVAFKIAESAQFKNTQKDIVENAKYLGEALEKNGLKLAYGGTDTHIVLVDLSSISPGRWFPLRGEIAVRMLDLAGIVANKNTIPGDTVTAEASGIRLGTPWITQRGITKAGIDELGNIISELLRNIVPFYYTGLTGDLPRGKIDIRILEDAKRRVDKLTGSLSSEKEAAGIGYPHYYMAGQKSGDSSRPEGKTVRSNCPDGPSGVEEKPFFYKEGIVIVRGTRAVQFLEGASTNKVTNLEPGKAQKSFFLDEDGKLIAPAIIHRLNPDDNGDDQFLILCRVDDRERLVLWLRGLSDGYLAFDRDDIFRKIEGPAIVLNADELTFEKWEKIPGALNAPVLKNREVPDFERDTDSKILYSSNPDCFDLSKPYFIGQGTVGADRREVEKEVFNCPEGSKEIRQSCLYDEHLKLTNSMVEFAGWKMPVRYESTIEEHRAVREKAGLFDVSHMGIFEITGAYAAQFLDVISTNYVSWMNDFESQYNYLLDIDGNIIDDIMIYRFSRDRYMVVVNAVNNDRDYEWIKAVNSRKIIIDRDERMREILSEVTIKDFKSLKGLDGLNGLKSLKGLDDLKSLKDQSSGSKSLVDMALQGPGSLDVLKKIAANDPVRDKLNRLEKFRFFETELGGTALIVSRTGYTGEEFGYELFLHPSKAPEFWNLILEAGKDEGVKPVGLGARDSLRIEAGLPLYGHELAGPLNLSPIEAGFGPYVKFHKPYFIGRRALFNKMESLKMAVVRFRMVSKGVRIAKQDDPVVSGRTQRIIGSVTSCAVDQNGIQVGMACVDKKFSREGIRIGIVPGVHDGRERSRPLGDLTLGDRFPLHGEAVVLSRFPDETGHFS